MKLKSSLMMLMTSAMVLSPVISTGLTNVSADTVQANSEQVQSSKLQPRFDGHSNVYSIQVKSGVVQVVDEYNILINTVDIDGNYVKHVPSGSQWKYDEIYYMMDGSTWYRVAGNEFLSDDVVTVIR